MQREGTRLPVVARSSQRKVQTVSERPPLESFCKCEHVETAALGDGDNGLRASVTLVGLAPIRSSCEMEALARRRSLGGFA